MNFNVLIVILGCFFLGSAAGAIGTFSYLRKQALIGDAIAHALLPGICLGFLLSGNKNPLYLILGAFISGWAATYLVEYISRTSKIKEDTAIAGILSVFFGLGIVLLTAIQHSGKGNQSGLDAFLFGQAAGMNLQEVYYFAGLSLFILAIIILLYRYFFSISFDKQFAQTTGMPIKLIRFMLTSATVLAVVAGIQAVGVVLMAALLITPAAAARYFTDRLSVMLLLGGLIGGFSGVAGALISYTAPNMPTGPWIVVILSLIAISAIVFAPKKGIVPRKIRQKTIQAKFARENVLKLFYQLGEINNDFEADRTLEDLQFKKSIASKNLLPLLHKLAAEKLVIKSVESWKLSAEGFKQAARLVKLHRLWELYLTEYLHIAVDHVHEDAETIEHIITPEIERKLEEKLKYPLLDPHSSPIPYQE